MDKKELGNKMLGTLNKTFKAAKTTATDTIVPGVSKAAKKAAEGIKDADIPGSIQKKAKDIQEQVKEKTEQKKTEAEAQKLEEENKALEATSIEAISPANSVKIFYYLMSVDGEISVPEQEQFETIGKELDPKFDEHKEQIIKTCKEQLDKIIDKEDHYDTIQDGVEEALLGQQISEDGFIPPMLLVWDLLTLAYSDDKYDEAERKLMKYIVRKLNVDKAVFLELEQTYLTIQDLEKELKWIKTTDRPYIQIELQVKEIEKREQDILAGIEALVNL